jgi:AraC-like DNA-binding protein
MPIISVRVIFRMDSSKVGVLKAEDWIKNPYPVQVMIRIHDKSMSFHRHDFFEFVFISRGTMTHVVNGSATILVPGDLFLIIPGEIHAYIDPRDAFIYNCLFTSEAIPANECESLPVIGSILYGAASPPQMLKVHVSPKRIQVISYILETLYDESRAENPGKAVALKSLLTFFLVEASRAFIEGPKFQKEQTTSYTNNIRTISDAIYGRLGQKLRIRDLAEEAGLSPGHFCRLFKEIYGITPQDYISRLRITFAMTQINATRLPIADIAQECGFQDQNYFSRVFRRLVGMTPVEYRRNKDCQTREQYDSRYW